MLSRVRALRKAQVLSAIIAALVFSAPLVTGSAGLFEANFFAKWEYAYALSALFALYAALRRGPRVAGETSVAQSPELDASATPARAAAWPWVVLPLVALLTLSVFSAGWSPNLGRVWESASRPATMILVYAAFYAWSLSPTAFRRGVAWPVAAVSAAALAGVFFRANIAGGAQAFDSALGFRNWVPIFLVCALPLILGGRARAYALLATAQIYLVLVYRTRSAWVALAFVLLGAILVAWRNKSQRWMLARVGGSLAVALILAVAVPTQLRWNSPHPYVQSLQSLSKPSLWSGRWELWRAAAHTFADAPWGGVGAGQWKVYAPAAWREVTRDQALPHRPVSVSAVQNDYLESAAELGVGGLLAFLSLAIAAPLALLARARRRRSGDASAKESEEPDRFAGESRALWLLVPLSVSLVALADYPFQRAETSLLFVATLAMLGAPGRGNAEPHQGSTFTPVARRALAALALLMLFPFALRVGAQLQYALYARTHDESQRQRAQRWWPYPLPWAAHPQNIALVRGGPSDAARHLTTDTLARWPYSAAAHALAAQYFEGQRDFARALEHDRVALSMPPRNENFYESYLRRIHRTDFPSGVPRLRPQELALYEEPRADPNGDLNGAELAPPFAQAQSQVVAWRGGAVFANNASGVMRPSFFARGMALPLFPPQVEISPQLELMSPVVLDAHRILFSGRAARGADRYALYLWNSTSQNLRRLSGEKEDAAQLCASSLAPRVAWQRNGRATVAAEINRDGSLRALGEWPVAFARCAWLDANTLVGVSSRGAKPLAWLCQSSPRLRCEVQSQLDGFANFTDFWRETNGELNFSAMGPGDIFRRAYRWRRNGKPQALVTQSSSPLQADVLGTQGTLARIGNAGAYGLMPLDPRGERGTVSAFTLVRGQVHAIVATPTHPRDLARWQNGDWQFASPVSPVAQTLRVVDIVTPAGRRVGAYYFGPDAQRVVVWWHGGPKENISPRYHPYFAALNAMGWSVLAVNYPGSTGRGRDYENDFGAGSRVDTARAVLDWLRQRGAQRVVSWSVSTGSLFQSEILREQMAYDGFVEQAGVIPTAPLRAQALIQKRPYFALHGNFDAHREDPAAYDWVYAGGHDLSQADDFAALWARIKDFLAKI